MPFKKDKPTWREEKKKNVPGEDREMLKEAEKKKESDLSSDDTSYKECIDAA